MTNLPEDRDSSLLSADVLELSVEEVRQLWSFVHGDIMDGAMRRQLRASLGLCPRHAWGHAVAEIELWQAGAGERAGHQPFDVAVLYEDLLEFTAAQLQRPASWLHPSSARLPAPAGPCRICMEVNSPLPEGLAMGYANSNSAALATEANQLIFMTAWCQETLPVWNNRSCPGCGGNGSGDFLCRRHLAAHGELLRAEGAALAARLLEVRSRLLRLIDSMTDHGQPARAEDDASWIEALGWFAGWGLPVQLASKPLPR